MVDGNKTTDVRGTSTESMHSQTVHVHIPTRKKLYLIISIMTAILIVSLLALIPALLIKKERATIVTKTTERSSTTSRRIIPVNEKTTWKQSGVTVAGSDYGGNRLDQLSLPRGFDVEDDSSIYIADQYNDRVVRWTEHAKVGEMIAGGNGKGNRTDQLHFPSDVVIDRKDASLIICDFGNDRLIRTFHHNPGHHTMVILKTVCNGLAFDRNGALYISDIKDYAIMRWKEGDLHTTIVAGGKGRGGGLDQFMHPRYVFVDEDDSLYIPDTYNKRVMKWVKDATEGVVLVDEHSARNNFTQLKYPTGVIVDHSGNIYITDEENHRVVRFSKVTQEGTFVVGRFGLHANENVLQRPDKILFDRHGNLYVVDSSNHRIQKFDVQL